MTIKSNIVYAVLFFAAAACIVFIFFDVSSNIKTLGEPVLITESTVMDVANNSLVKTKSTKNTNEVEFNSVSKNTFQAKLDKEQELNKLASLSYEIFSEKGLYEKLIQRGAKIDDDMAQRMKKGEMIAADRDMVNVLMGELYSQDENFKIELKQYNNFKEIKDAADKTSKVTGKFYGSDILNELMAYKGSTVNDIKQLLDSGAVLPDEAMRHIIYANNIDLAVSLKKAGYNLNVNYYDNFASMNAIETQAQLFSINPSATSGEEKIADIKKLVDLGIPLKVVDGTRNALDLVLEGISNQSLDDADQLFNLAKYINKQGLPLEENHQQLLMEIKNKYPALYEKYYRDFQ